MILTSGKVVGNQGAQWKEVRDRRVQGKEKQAGDVAKTGQEIVPVDSQEGIVPQQVQTTNKFAVLEVENSEDACNNQLLVRDDSAVQIDVSKPKDPEIKKNAEPVNMWELQRQKMGTKIIHQEPGKASIP